MVWALLGLVGTVGFAVSGAMVALEEKYDIFGVYTLGLITAFAGGTVRNVLLGVPVTNLWNQGDFFAAAFIAITLILVVPEAGTRFYKSFLLFDAVGLAAFSVQGALLAARLQLPVGACMAAAVLTGTGGGIIRDVLAGRKPLVFRKQVYALWALFAGFVVGTGEVEHTAGPAVLFLVILSMRLISLYANWHLPARE